MYKLFDVLYQWCNFIRKFQWEIGFPSLPPPLTQQVGNACISHLSVKNCFANNARNSRLLTMIYTDKTNVYCTYNFAYLRGRAIIMTSNKDIMVICMISYDIIIENSTLCCIGFNNSVLGVLRIIDDILFFPVGYIFLVLDILTHTNCRYNAQRLSWICSSRLQLGWCVGWVFGVGIIG